MNLAWSILGAVCRDSKSIRLILAAVYNSTYGNDVRYEPTWTISFKSISLHRETHGKGQGTETYLLLAFLAGHPSDATRTGADGSGSSGWMGKRRTVGVRLVVLFCQARP